MKPLICPQCGGKITEYSPQQNFATCGYCETRFVIEQQKSASQTEPVYEPLEVTDLTPNLIISIVVAACLVIGGVFFIAILTNRKPAKPTVPVYNPPKYPTASPRSSPLPTPNPNQLEFGGKGTGNGLFQDADTVAIDSKGKIYVGDDTLRVQQFNEKGEFLKVWQIPSKTVNYKRARKIDKIAVSDDGKLYVAVGGVILIYDQESSEPLRTVHVAPDYIQDFALRKDGGLLFISNNDEIETLIFVNKGGKITRRISGFHTDTADAALSPPETGLAAIRLAVDGAGNIFSVYAFGDLGSYQLSFNAEELLIFRFNPEGKYINKFVQSMNSCGIEVDNQSRIYITDNDSINVYSNTGEQVSSIPDLQGIDAFALDTENNVYFIKDDKVYKRRGIK